MGKKKRGGGGGTITGPNGVEGMEQQVDALADLLGGVFPTGAVRGVLARCAGDTERALDILLSTAPEAHASSAGPIPGYAHSSSSSSSSSAAVSRGSDDAGEQRQCSVEEEDRDCGSGQEEEDEEEGRMVTVASASQRDVAEYAAARAAAAAERGRALSEDGGSSSMREKTGGVSAWELLSSMFEGLLPQRALYARFHGEGEEEGDLAAMVEEAAHMLANEQAEDDGDDGDEQGEQGEEGNTAPVAVPPPSLASTTASTVDAENDGPDEEDQKGLAGLQTMFPSLPRNFLRATLRSFGGDVDAAAYDLLGGSPPSSTTPAAHPLAATQPKSPPRHKRHQQQQQQQQRIIPIVATSAADASSSRPSPWAPSTTTFALSPPSAAAAATTALLRKQASSGESSIFAPAVNSTEAFPHLPPSSSSSSSSSSKTACRSARAAAAAAPHHHHRGQAARTAARELQWLETVYGPAFDRDLIRLLATEVHSGDAAAVECSLAEMDPKGFARCRQERARRAKEAALLRNLSLSSPSPSSSSSSTSTPSFQPPPTPLARSSPSVGGKGGGDARAAAAACRREAEAERAAMVAGFKRAAAAFHGKGPEGSAAALIAQGGYAHRAKMQRADAQAAACLLEAQSDPPLSVAAVERGDGGVGVMVTGARADAGGGLTVDLHGLRVREGVQAVESLVPLLGPARVRTLRVITGLGTHSRHGKARLGPAVLRALSAFPHLRVNPDSGAIGVRVRAQRP